MVPFISHFALSAPAGSQTQAPAASEVKDMLTAGGRAGSEVLMRPYVEQREAWQARGRASRRPVADLAEDES